MRARLAEAFSDKAFHAKLLFVNNAFYLYKDFLALFQSTETSVHRFFGEMLALVHKLCGRFMKVESYNTKTGKYLLLLQPSSSMNWKQRWKSEKTLKLPWPAGRQPKKGHLGNNKKLNNSLLRLLRYTRSKINNRMQEKLETETREAAMHGREQNERLRGIFWASGTASQPLRSVNDFHFWDLAAE